MLEIKYTEYSSNSVVTTTLHFYDLDKAFDKFRQLNSTVGMYNISLSFNSNASKL